MVPNSVPTRPWLKNSQKNRKKFKKHRSSLFVAKLALDRPRNRKKKKKIPNSVPIRPWIMNSQKNSKKIQIIKKHNSSFISSQIGLR